MVAWNIGVTHASNAENIGKHIYQYYSLDLEEILKFFAVST